MVGIPGKALHGTPREGSGSLSMQPVGCTPWCSTDALLIVEQRHRLHLSSTVYVPALSLTLAAMHVLHNGIANEIKEYQLDNYLRMR